MTLADGTEINDIPMLISYGSNFTKHPGMPYSIQDCTDFFMDVYQKYIDQKNKDIEEWREFARKYKGEK